MAARIFQLLDKSFVDLDKLLKLLEDKFGADYQVEYRDSDGVYVLWVPEPLTEVSAAMQESRGECGDAGIESFIALPHVPFQDDRSLYRAEFVAKGSSTVVARKQDQGEDLDAELSGRCLVDIAREEWRSRGELHPSGFWLSCLMLSAGGLSWSPGSLGTFK
ncbi:hypothetical protein IQ06DRAFT_305562 [Phaeosphaeriaceae sp. SRC1lsM3a]|nr:hypothetical protein IQ06DRAFT_305562 [Stagonospora sp. SRC1lsM3a]